MSGEFMTVVQATKEQNSELMNKKILVVRDIGLFHKTKSVLHYFIIKAGMFYRSMHLLFPSTKTIYIYDNKSKLNLLYTACPSLTFLALLVCKDVE